MHLRELNKCLVPRAFGRESLSVIVINAVGFHGIGLVDDQNLGRLDVAVRRTIVLNDS